MKKSIVLLLVLILGVSLLAGCSSGGDGKAADDGSSYGIDLNSSDVQQMSENRAARDKLTETVEEWMDGATMFLEGTEHGKRTYKDFADFIGCDATEYYFDASRNSRVYTWIADGEDNSKLSVWFEKRGGIWCSAYSGSTNL